MILVLRWRCSDPAVEVIIRAKQTDEAKAGIAAAWALTDLAKGRGRVGNWTPLLPVVEQERT